MSERPVLYIGEKNVSSWSMRAWVALTVKSVPFEERTIPLVEDLDRARRRQVSPTGRVPVLHHRGLVIPDSLAIIEYLEEAFPPPRHPALWPADSRERSRARWLAATMHSGFSYLRQGMPFNLCFLERPPRPPAEALVDAAEMLALFETILGTERRDGPFLLGPFGAVDIMYATAAVRLKAFRVALDATPRAALYVEALLAHPAVRSWMDAARALPPVERH